jgi:hypothetical protein
MRSRHLSSAVRLLAGFLALAAAASSPRGAEPEPPGKQDPVQLVLRPPPTNRTIAYLEVVGVNLALNLGGRILKPEEDSYNFTLETWKANLSGNWEYDPNSYATNQYAHPYEGSLFMTSCRSNGLQFWESSLCTVAGSYIWEVFMEIHPPSINDQITTSVAGTFLGEMLFRISTDILAGGEGRPDFWRELAAAAVSPMNGLNRAAQGDRYHDPRLVGFPWSGELAVAVGVAGRAKELEQEEQFRGGTLRLIGRITHGLPTEEGWRFRRPFDHFDVSTSVVVDRNTFTNAAGINLLIRGLLLGDDYGEGVSSGLWGLWGAYDVITAGDMRASTSALAFGTVRQWAPSPSHRIQATAYLGAGFGAAGVSVDVEDKRDYHFGAQAIGLVDLRWLYGNRFRARASVREYVTGDELSPDQGGFEDLAYGLGDLTFRVAGRHALGVELVAGRRTARYPDVPDTRQEFRQVSLTYVLGGDPSLGAGGALNR